MIASAENLPAPVVGNAFVMKNNDEQRLLSLCMETEALGAVWLSYEYER